MKTNKDMTSIGISAKSLFRYQGGKQGSCNLLADLLPSSFGAYFELMVGALSIYLAVHKKGFRGPAFLGDYNPEITNVHMTVKRCPSGFLTEYAVHAANDSKTYFDKVRDADASGWSSMRRAARTVYLAKAGFCGLLRTKPDGRFAVHYGDGKQGRVRLDPAVVHLVAKALWSATIIHADFGWVEPLARKGDLVVVDPPYANTNDRYTAVGFGVNDQQRLAALCRNLDERGVFLLQTNSDCPFIRDIYQGFRFITVPPRPSLCCNGTSKQPGGEVVITNFESSAEAVKAFNPAA